MTTPSSPNPISPSLSEQVVLVTGGARGLGRAITEAFLREGARVVVNYFSSKAAAHDIEAAHPHRVLAIHGDVRERDDMDAIFTTARDKFGQPISTVVNNALTDFSFNGEARPKADHIGYESFQSQFSSAIQGALNDVHVALPSFERVHGGRIINIGTNLFQNPVVPYHDYTAAKAALLSLTRTFSTDLGPKGITVNMVSGGLLRTTDASAATPDDVFDAIAANTPLRSVTTPEELADAVLFFASPWARAITGQNLVVDGGLVKD